MERQTLHERSSIFFSFTPITWRSFLSCRERWGGGRKVFRYIFVVYLFRDVNVAGVFLINIAKVNGI